MTLDDLDTPFLVADLDIVERNIARYQAYLDQHRILNRPHIKTHKLPLIAWKQVRGGAVGIACQKLGEAETMAQAGLPDIFIAYNIVGAQKLDRLRALALHCTLSAACDSEHTLRGYARAGREAGVPIRAVIEVDTGGKRAGVQTVEEAVALARLAADLDGVTFQGLMTYPTFPATQGFFEQIVDTLERDGIPTPVRSGGGSPGIFRAHETPICNEHRAGTNLYCDRNLVGTGVYAWDDCALRVVTTVVSRPNRERMIIDAGSKTTTNDRHRTGNFHYFPDLPDAIVERMSEEHGHCNIAACASPPSVGDRLTLIPNHACGTTNMHDQIALHRRGRVEAITPIPARGKIR
jgi:D-serine deaminase-like pyridoxal phosphate-dependent protein